MADNRQVGDWVNLILGLQTCYFVHRAESPPINVAIFVLQIRQQFGKKGNIFIWLPNWIVFGLIKKNLMHITFFSDLIENKRAKTTHGKWIGHAHNWGVESDTQLALRPQGPATITH